LKTSTTLLAVLALAGALGVAWWVQRPPVAASAKSTGAAQPGAAGGAPARAAVVVEAAPVRRQAVADDVEAVGSLRSRQGTVVRAEVSGRVVQIGFRDGQKVARGQLLVQLDDRLQQAQLQQAQAELSIAQANHRRNTELVAQGFISQRGLDESAAAVKVALAKAELARATAARMRVLAPFDGVAGLRNISVGDYLKDGADIVNLEDMNAMYVDFRLPERWQARVRPGQSARGGGAARASLCRRGAGGGPADRRQWPQPERARLHRQPAAAAAPRHVRARGRAPGRGPRGADDSRAGRGLAGRPAKRVSTGQGRGPRRGAGLARRAGGRADRRAPGRLGGDRAGPGRGRAGGHRRPAAHPGRGALLRVADAPAGETPQAPGASAEALPWAETPPGPSPCGAVPAR
jgi:multidrug efflux pump subunit AcrA (membrane-fusion protein)